MLSASNLSKAYGELTALDGLDLELRAGECLALIGHNGSGKTTALGLAAGHLEPTAGEVKVRGANVHGEKDSLAARGELALVTDSPALYGDLTVGEHLELVGLAHDVEGLDGRAAGLLETFGLGGYRDFIPGKLSRGLRQKVNLACAFVRPFSVLMLDEPVVGLDPRSQNELHRMLLETKSWGAAVFLTTHQIEFARGLADRAVFLEEGKAVSSGPLGEVTEGEEALRLGLS